MPNKKVISALAITLFSVIIILGEAFKINLGFGKVSLSLVVIGCTLALKLNKSLKFYLKPLDVIVYIYGFVFLIFAILGVIVGNSIGDIFEDLYPILVFVTLFIIWRSFELNEILKIWKAIILFSILAAIKVIIVGIVPFEIQWDNNWQAMKEPLPFGGFSRIILRGGDTYLSFALVYYMLDAQSKQNASMIKSIGLIGLLLLAVFISLSRSSFLGVGVALFFTFNLFHHYFSTKRLSILAVAIFSIFLALMPFFNTITLAASIFEARTEAFDSNNISVSFREDERSLILEKSSSVYYLGNGLGSYFYLDLSGSDKKDDRSLYAHDFNMWVILKTGILGLLLFYAIFFKSCYNLYWCLKQKKHALHREYNMLLLSLFASGILIWVISFLANKLSTLSGCLFFAFFAASSSIIRNKYENSI